MNADIKDLWNLFDNYYKHSNYDGMLSIIFEIEQLIETSTDASYTFFLYEQLEKMLSVRWPTHEQL